MAGKSSNKAQLSIGETIIQRNMDEVMHQSMMPYAEHVILERALPRVEDGLKPVQRRILYTMLELSLSPDKPHRKSARIVGDALGKYHPHGDTSVYDAMVRMAQSFNMQMPLVDGHGNFGSVDGDSAAAMRYTEARMTPLAMEMLRDIDKDTVKFSLNFDDTLKEPDVLTSRFPNLLVNGSSGIAVGLATNIPPHNLRETIDAIIAQIDTPDISTEEIMRHMPCPDFPTGGYILDSGELKTAYETGRGKITMRAKAEIEPQKNGKNLIVITELPYQVNKAKVLEEILNVSQEKRLLFSGIADIRDETDRMGMRAVIEIKKDADPEKILQYLYKYSQLQCTFGINIVAIAEGKPQQLGLKQALDFYIMHQKDVVTRRTIHDLEAAQRREHILSGLMIAVLNIDEVIAMIRSSKSPKIAKERLMEFFSLDEIQAQAILDLKLQRLTNLELIAIENEHKEVQKLIKELKSILLSPQKLMNVIKGELSEIREKYGIDRRTVMLKAESEIVIDQEDLKVVEDVVVALFGDLKARMIPKRSYNYDQIAQECPFAVFDTQTDKKLRLFTNLGYALLLPVSDIPESKAGSKQVNLASIMQMEKGENIVSAYEEFDEGKIFFYTVNGLIKCSEASEYKTKNKRIAAIALKEGDRLLGVERESGGSVLMLTKKGMSIRFPVSEVPVIGRVGAGVKGMKLEAGDCLVFAKQLSDEGEILTITDRGYAKRSFVFDYDLQGRYGKGLKSFDFKKNGSNGTAVVWAFHVCEPFDFVVEQLHGTVTELNTEQILIEQRAGKGQIIVTSILDDVIVAARRK